MLSQTGGLCWAVQPSGYLILVSKEMELKEIAKAYIRYLKEKPLTPVIEERLRYWKDILVKFS